MTLIKQTKINKLTIFYRESSDPTCPTNKTLLLLHGFPSSSHQYRNLIPLLSKHYRVIAPDLPGFGFTTVPDDYEYTFENITNTVSAFLDALQIDKCAVYIFDYGAPIALRLALQRPTLFTGIISQNGNAYEEGLGGFWDPVKKYWESNSGEDREALRSVLSFETTKAQYLTGTKNPEVIPPETYWLDYSLLCRDRNADIQLDLFRDYEENVKLYPKFQEYLRESQIPLLAAWGKNDPIFIPAGAEAFKKDLPNAEVHLIDAGHFALESNLNDIAGLVMTFLERKVK
ncbi:hypothetical protein MW887_002486 [Aspergillus wentii]|nr:hypothetical protein MW887_002486 [Aspergillus wentii]